MAQRSTFGLIGVGIALAALVGLAFASWTMTSRHPAVPRDGDMAKFMVEERPAVQLSVTDLTGKPLSLEELYGPLLLVNFWATWCAPCVKELPTLRDLQQAEGGEGLQVVTIALDRGGANIVAPFLAAQGLGDLPVYLDPRATAMAAFTLRGLPTSVLLAADGRELGRLEGEADWNGEAARALIRHYRGQAAARPSAAP